MMEEKNQAMHSDGCVCNSEKMMAHKHKHHLLKLAVGIIFLFMAFWIGVQLGEIKGALGLSEMQGYHGRTMQPQMMYGGQGMMQGNIY